MANSHFFRGIGFCVAVGSSLGACSDATESPLRAPTGADKDSGAVVAPDGGAPRTDAAAVALRCDRLAQPARVSVVAGLVGAVRRLAASSDGNVVALVTTDGLQLFERDSADKDYVQRVAPSAGLWDKHIAMSADGLQLWGAKDKFLGSELVAVSRSARGQNFAVAPGLTGALNTALGESSATSSVPLPDGRVLLRRVDTNTALTGLYFYRAALGLTVAEKQAASNTESLSPVSVTDDGSVVYGVAGTVVVPLQVRDELTVRGAAWTPGLSQYVAVDADCSGLGVEGGTVYRYSQTK